jgi:ABC-type multidrug transport system fused ATPase/permease subunit
VKAFAMEEKEIMKYEKHNILSCAIGLKRAWIYGGFSFLFTTFMYGAMVVIIWYGTNLNSKNELTVGNITSYLFYCIQILVYFALLQSLITTLMQVSGASTKILEFIDH